MHRLTRVRQYAQDLVGLVPWPRQAEGVAELPSRFGTPQLFEEGLTQLEVRPLCWRPTQLQADKHNFRVAFVVSLAVHCDERVQNSTECYPSSVYPICAAQISSRVLTGQQDIDQLRVHLIPS